MTLAPSSDWTSVYSAAGVLCPYCFEIAAERTIMEMKISVGGNNSASAEYRCPVCDFSPLPVRFDFPVELRDSPKAIAAPARDGSPMDRPEGRDMPLPTVFRDAATSGGARGQANGDLLKSISQMFPPIIEMGNIQASRSVSPRVLGKSVEAGREGEEIRGFSVSYSTVAGEIWSRVFAEGRSLVAPSVVLEAESAVQSYALHVAANAGPVYVPPSPLGVPEVRSSSPSGDIVVSTQRYIP